MAEKVKVIYNCRDIVLLQAYQKFVVCTHFQGFEKMNEPGEPVLVLGQDLRSFFNPLQAFDYWIEKVAEAGYQRIGKYLAAQGNDPNTGEFDPQLIREACERVKKMCERIKKDR